MTSIRQRLESVGTRIRAAERRFGRPPGSVSLLAVSKTHPPGLIAEAAGAGQLRFGENYLQEALEKIDALATLDLEWHFIGPLQSNKTRRVAEVFHWVHSVDRLKIARRLSEQRPPNLPPLDICLQVNISDEPSKSGLDLDALPGVAMAVADLPRLRLRGLMTVPAPADGLDAQRRPLARLREARDALVARGLALDTLSMGMSGDLEAAVAEGATIVRIGTAIFGPREARDAAMS